MNITADDIGKKIKWKIKKDKRTFHGKLVKIIMGQGGYESCIISTKFGDEIQINFDQIVSMEND